jgi:hypothetical protein
LYLFFHLCYISPGHIKSRRFALHVIINPVATGTWALSVMNNRCGMLAVWKLHCWYWFKQILPHARVTVVMTKLPFP